MLADKPWVLNTMIRVSTSSSDQFAVLWVAYLKVVEAGYGPPFVSTGSYLLTFLRRKDFHQIHT